MLRDVSWLNNMNTNQMPNNDKPVDMLKMFNDILNKKPSIKEQAIINDNRLKDIATYDVTKGLMIKCENPDEIVNKFTEFKMLVRRGSFTIDQLEDSVCKRYGVINKEGANNNVV